MSNKEELLKRQFDMYVALAKDDAASPIERFAHASVAYGVAVAGRHMFPKKSTSWYARMQEAFILQSEFKSRLCGT